MYTYMFRGKGTPLAQAPRALSDARSVSRAILKLTLRIRGTNPSTFEEKGTPLAQAPRALSDASEDTLPTAIDR